MQATRLMDLLAAMRELSLWLAMFAGLNLAASSAKTRKQLGWESTGPGLIVGLENMRYR